MRYIRGFVSAVMWLAIVEWRLFANLWPMLLAYLTWALSVLQLWYFLGRPVSTIWLSALLFVAIFPIGRAHDWLEANSAFYNRMRFTGAINPVFDK